jgi:hypothetical protein
VAYIGYVRIEEGGIQSFVMLLIIKKEDDMKASILNKINIVSFSLFLFSSTILFAQGKGTTKAEFFDKKVIIIDEVTENGKTDSTRSEIDASENYTAIRGDEFTLSFLISKYNRKGENEQKIPYVNLTRKLFLNEIVTFIKRDTIQLPDQVVATGDHFTFITQGESHKSDIWVDERGIIILCTMLSLENESFICFQKNYSKNNNSGEICSLNNGQYWGTTKWEIIDFEKDVFTLNINAAIVRKFGGFKMTFQYKLDNHYNPKSYIEQWSL